MKHDEEQARDTGKAMADPFSSAPRAEGSVNLNVPRWVKDFQQEVDKGEIHRARRVAFENYRQTVESYAQQRLGSKEMASQVTNVVFETMAKAISKPKGTSGALKDPSCIRGWLNRVTARTCDDFVKAGRPLKKNLLSLDSMHYIAPDSASTSIASGADPLQAMLDAEISEELSKLLAERLTDLERSVLLARADGLLTGESSAADIAANLGRTEEAVNNALKRARNKLVPALTPYHVRTQLRTNWPPAEGQEGRKRTAESDAGNAPADSELIRQRMDREIAAIVETMLAPATELSDLEQAVLRKRCHDPSASCAELADCFAVTIAEVKTALRLLQGMIRIRIGESEPETQARLLFLTV